MIEEKFPIPHVSLRIFPAHLPYFVLFPPQNMDKSESNNTRYPPFSCPGTLGDKILHCVVREEFFKLAIELGRQGLVVGDDQRRFIQLLDDICHRESLTRTGDAKEGLTLVTFLEAFDQVGDGLGLVAGGGVF